MTCVVLTCVGVKFTETWGHSSAADSDRLPAANKQKNHQQNRQARANSNKGTLSEEVLAEGTEAP
jgi:hypothetical protein